MVSTLRTLKGTQKTVKAFGSDIAFINEESKRSGCSAAEVIHEMCEKMRKEIYLQKLGESFDLVVAYDKQFAAFQAAQEVLDSALSAGLDNAS